MEMLWDLQIINDIKNPICCIASSYRAARKDVIRAKVTSWLSALADKGKRGRLKAFLCIPLFCRS